MTPPSDKAWIRWGLPSLTILAWVVAFRTGIQFSARWIWDRPEYSHGLLIPFISAFLVWQRWPKVVAVPFEGSVLGVAIVVAAVLLDLMGRFASAFIIQQFAALLAFYGICLAWLGRRAFMALWMPLMILMFMIPMPDFLYKNLSSQLQLISSSIGVWFIRLFGVSVYLEGNVIDLGVYQLQVAEACDGLRYLFPLMTLGFIVAYFFKGAFWKRALVFASSVPITILMNSLRIGTIGVMVEHWGITMAEGFLHEFQGWAVFMVSLGFMFLEMFALSRVGHERLSWRESFGIELEDRRARAGPNPLIANLSRSLLASLVILSAAISLAMAETERVESVPVRKDFGSFPMSLGEWRGHREKLERVYTDQLLLDDYLMANFTRFGSRSVNFYVAWYDSQQAGRSAHSPRSCLPGGGWEIQTLKQIEVPNIVIDGQLLRVNRVLIQLGEQRQLVYYWFQQRGRILTNEYAAKWYLFWDSLTRQRSDGALVRMVVPLQIGESSDTAESELVDFAASVSSRLGEFVPG